MTSGDRLVWGSVTKADIEGRNAHVMELYAMGWSRRELADRFMLTPQRISQIVNDFGYTFREASA